MAKIEYEKLATKVLLTTLNDNRQTRFIDSFLKRTEEDELVYYIGLLDGLVKNKFYQRQLHQRTFSGTIVAKADGIMLFKDVEATGYDPLIAIGNIHEDMALVGKQLEQLLEQCRVEKKEIPNVFLIDNVYVHLAHKTIPSDYIDFNVVFHYNIGDKIKKNRTIITIEGSFYTASAKRSMRRFNCAKNYCEVKIELLKKKRGIVDIITPQIKPHEINIATEPFRLSESKSKIKKKNIVQIKKQQVLKDLFYQDKQYLYEGIIEKLFDLEYKGKAIIKQKSDKIMWQPVPVKGWQRYLAAFIDLLEQHQIVDKAKYNGSVPILIEVLRKTFNIEKLSPDSFLDMIGANKLIYASYRMFFADLTDKFDEERS